MGHRSRRNRPTRSVNGISADVTHVVQRCTARVETDRGATQQHEVLTDDHARSDKQKASHNVRNRGKQVGQTDELQQAADAVHGDSINGVR